MPVSFIPTPSGNIGVPDADINLTKYSTQYTDFMTAISSGGGVYCDSLTFVTSNAGAGGSFSSTTTGVDATFKALGVAQQYSGTGAGTSSNYTALNGSSFRAGISTLVAVFRSWLDSVGSVAEGYEWTAGFIDNSAASQQHTDGAYFRFLGDGVNTNYSCVTSAGGVRTTTVTTVPVVINTEHIFEVQINEAGTQVVFFIDGVVVATHTTNIPGAGQLFAPGFKMHKTVGTAQRYAYYDWFKFQASWIGGR